MGYLILDPVDLWDFLQFLVVGTHWGMIHIFDHAGNAIRDKEIAAVSTDLSYRHAGNAIQDKEIAAVSTDLSYRHA